MNIRNTWLAIGLAVASFLSPTVWSEDIDIFNGTVQEEDENLPSVIFILDNSANWSRQSQQWPGGLTQGQSEVRAIKTALAAQVGKLNVGLMEYNTGGSSADRNAGYTRFDLQLYDAAAQTEFEAIMDKIFDDIEEPEEKRDSSNPYGDLPWDFYNYLSGIDHSNDGAGTLSLADEDAYSSNYDVFESPLTEESVCGDVYLIFIGNNVNGAIEGDDNANSDALKAAYAALGVEEGDLDAFYGDDGDPLRMPEFASRLEDVTTVIPGYTIPAYTIPAVDHPAGPVGVSAGCYRANKIADCTSAQKSEPNCGVGEGDCFCTVPDNTSGCNGGRAHYVVEAVAWTEPEVEVPEEVVPEQTITETIETYYATGDYDDETGLPYNFDDWAKFLHDYGIPVEVTVEGEGDDEDVTYEENINVITYTIDVYNRQSNPDLSSVWFSAADAGGGRYFQAASEEEILASINAALGDILAVSSSFAAVTLPVSANNRAQVDNEVYIGMFRPSQGKEPRWFGNMKRYRLALFDGVVRIADANFRRAINPLTGFARECAESYWTTDTDDYWAGLGYTPPPQGDCTDPDAEEWSDLPDGPMVEKGGAAQQVREGGARNLLTVASGAITTLGTDDADDMGGDAVYDYFIGDEEGIGELMPDAGLRASVHGDVIHSRPTAVRQSADDVTLYVGSNDGLFRAVNAEDGSERWSLVVPEHFDKLARLYNNSPLIKFTGDDTPGTVLKDYFFDGSTGQITSYDDDGVLEYAYIFPTMRRGGRMVYALDVTDPDSDPDLLWSVGCDEDDNCTTGFDDIGGTWSLPIGGVAEGYDGGVDNPDDQIIAFGGGFDDCLNEDVAAYPASCSTADGKGVYILDAVDGELLVHFDTDAPVITDLAPVDIDFDGNLDFLYVADVEGALYRVNFVSLAVVAGDPDTTALEEADWTIEKIAYQTDDERRFYNSPAVGALGAGVVVTIGTGDRERPLDINYPYTTPVQNRFYTFFDEPYKTIVGDAEEPEAGETHVIDLDGDTMLAVVEDPDPDEDPLEEFDGWYMDLVDHGEQVVNPAAIGGGRVFFSSFQPGGTSDSLCTPPLGVGTVYDINLFDPEFSEGEEITSPGIPIPPIIVTVVIEEGIPDDCEGDGCDPPEEGSGKKKRVCPGCGPDGDPVEIVPDAPPIRQRIFFTEDIDRDASA